MNRRRIVLVAGAVALAVAVWIVLALISRGNRNDYSGTIETREIEIGSKIGGRVTSVPVEEGQAVKAGQVLVRFECDQLEAQRAQAAAQVIQAQADLDKMLRGNRPEEIAEAESNASAEKAALEEANHGPRPQEISQAQADLAAAQADSVDAEKFYRRMAKLVASDTISRQQFDDARDKRDSAAERAESARQHFALLQAGTRPEDLAAARAHFAQAQSAAVLARRGFRKEDIEAARGKLAQAQAQVAELDAQLKEAILIAPADALVEVVSVRPGDLVTPNRIVIDLLEPTQLWVKIYIPETDLARVHTGQSATVRIDSYAGQVFSGQVREISSEAEFLPRNVQTRSDREHQVFGARVYVDNLKGILKSGMSATVRLQ